MDLIQVKVFFLILGLLALTFSLTLGIMGLIFWLVDRRRMK